MAALKAPAAMLGWLEAAAPWPAGRPNYADARTESIVMQRTQCLVARVSQSAHEGGPESGVCDLPGAM